MAELEQLVTQVDEQLNVFLQTMEAVQHNVDSLFKPNEKLFGKDAEVTMVNNYDWLSELSLLDFFKRLREKNFNVNTMLAKRHCR